MLVFFQSNNKTAKCGGLVFLHLLKQKTNWKIYREKQFQGDQMHFLHKLETTGVEQNEYNAQLDARR